MNKWTLISVLSLFLGLCGAAEPKYIGSQKCKKCHNKEKIGAQYKTWSENAHAKAFTTLASEKSKEVAKKAGVEGDPQKAPECLKCHITAYGDAPDKKEASLTNEEGVGCEACHGAGSEYKSKSVMKDHEKAIAAGLIVPDEAVCTKCHNEESPTFKPFNFEERKKEIAHPIPGKKK